MIRAALSVSLVAVLLTCGTSPQRCTATTCQGCCTNDVCLDGTTSNACGSSGAECETCSAAQFCNARVCVSPGGGPGGGAGGGSAGAGGAGGSSGGAGGSSGGSGGGGTGGRAGGSAGGAAGGTAGGAPSGLCDFNYGIRAMPQTQGCLTATVTWPNPVARVTQQPDGGFSINIATAIPDGGAPLGMQLRGSWDTTGFTATGQATISYMSLNLPVTNTVTGRFENTCDRFSARWQQSASLCNLTWDAGGTRQ